MISSTSLLNCSLLGIWLLLKILYYKNWIKLQCKNAKGTCIYVHEYKDIHRAWNLIDEYELKCFVMTNNLSPNWVNGVEAFYT